MLSHQAIKEFQKIYKKEYGEDISHEEAAESGQKLLNLYKVVYKDPIKNKKTSKDFSIYMP
jgi:hypothetical protein